jgi:uncharacterized protein YcfL
MRNILLGFILTLFFIGCGSETKETVVPTATTSPSSSLDRPSTPNIEAEKAPPSIPNL